MASNASRGAAAKARSKRWLEQQDFTVWDMEINRVIYTPNGVIAVKRDQVGSDLAFMDESGVVFCQVKSGRTKSNKRLIADAMKAFAQFRFAPKTRRVLHIWRIRARAPEVIACP